MNALKERLHQACVQQLQQRMDGLQQRLDDLRQALTQATKSSAGDKYETSRAMVHLEQEKLLQQRAQQQRLHQLDPTRIHQKAQLGSLICTNKGNYYLSIALGKVVLEQKNYYALSLAAPLGKQLLHKRVGERFQFNQQSFEVEALF